MGEKLYVFDFLFENQFVLLNFNVEVFIVVLSLDPNPLKITTITGNMWKCTVSPLLLWRTW